MKEYKDTKLLSDSCMAKREFEGLHGGSRWLQKRVGLVQIIHSDHGKVTLDREEIKNLILFLEDSLNEEF